jgi:hypothetical protein
MTTRTQASGVYHQFRRALTCQRPRQPPDQKAWVTRSRTSELIPLVTSGEELVILMHRL